VVSICTINLNVKKILYSAHMIFMCFVCISEKKTMTFSLYSGVSFCDSSFYDDSLLRPLSSRTEHSPTCGVSLSQLKRPFSTQCPSSSFPVCMCFFFCYISAVLLSWLWFFHPWRPTKRQKRWKKSKQLTLHSFLMSSEPRPGPSSAK